MRSEEQHKCRQQVCEGCEVGVKTRRKGKSGGCVEMYVYSELGGVKKRIKCHNGRRGGHSVRTA